MKVNLISENNKKTKQNKPQLEESLFDFSNNTPWQQCQKLDVNFNFTLHIIIVELQWVWVDPTIKSMFVRKSKKRFRQTKRNN